MPSLQTILASLGNAGAVSNARQVIEQGEQETWLVSCLAAKLAEPAPPVPVPHRQHRRTRLAA